MADRPRSIRRTAVLTALTASTTLMAAFPAWAGDPTPSGEESRFVRLLNAERVRRSLPVVTSSSVLTAIADDYVAENVRMRDITHERDAPYIARARAAGCDRNSWSGPVLAMDTRGVDAADALRMWLGSPGHRQVIMDRNVTHVGVGLQDGQAVAFLLPCPVGRKGPVSVGLPRVRSGKVRIGVTVHRGPVAIRIEARRGKRTVRSPYWTRPVQRRAYRLAMRVPRGSWRISVRVRTADGKIVTVPAGQVRR